MKKLEKGLINLFGEGVKSSVYFEGKTIKGTMYGNNECFSCNDFYQYLLTEDNQLLYCFYDISNVIELDEINYDYPNTIENAMMDIETIEDYAD